MAITCPPPPESIASTLIVREEASGAPVSTRKGGVGGISAPDGVFATAAFACAAVGDETPSPPVAPVARRPSPKLKFTLGISNRICASTDAGSAVDESRFTLAGANIWATAATTGVVATVGLNEATLDRLGALARLGTLACV